MQREPVVSSVMQEVGYDAACRTLEILFQSGAIYLYYFVPAEVHKKLMGASSHGTYFNTHIKHTYEHHRIAEPYAPTKPRRRKPALVSKPKKLPVIVAPVIEEIPARPTVEKPPERQPRSTRKPRKRRERQPATDTGRASAGQGNPP